MTEQHECEWVCATNEYLECKFCPAKLNPTEAERRLNEYETLKKATERLSAKVARDIYERASVYDTFDSLPAYADILEGNNENERR